jgi:glycerol-3-phosphate dehydrogenase
VLVERRDFGGGTTAASTRLVHGGLRYLAMGDLRLVRLDLRERETLLRIAPHLVAPLPFLLPLKLRGAMERCKLRAGMLLYDVLSYDKSLPAHRMLDVKERLRLEPGLDATRFCVPSRTCSTLPRMVRLPSTTPRRRHRSMPASALPVFRSVIV